MHIVWISGFAVAAVSSSTVENSSLLTHFLMVIFNALSVSFLTLKGTL